MWGWGVRVLIACEFSGIVREAFRKRGHDAWSCDLLESEDESEYHIQWDAAKVSRGWWPWPQFCPSWDLMIAHPPCTYLANSGVRWLHGNEERLRQLDKACVLFNKLKTAPIKHIAIENPIPHKYAVSQIGKYNQIIQPWQFGHGETKATCLWLKNLPKLVPTNIVEGRTPRVHHASPGPDRWKERSRTLQGIADAMAEQWGVLQ